MRRGVTLVELIFSIVIISIVFSIIPKIIFASNKSMQTSIKEDALFNAYTLLGSILKLPWDENTARGGNILSVSGFDCLSSRVGLFVGARECQRVEDGNHTATPIGVYDPSGVPNDIGDYNGYEISTSVNENSRYKLDVGVSYVASNNNLKEIDVKVSSDSDKTQGFESSFFYYSANLGHVQIKKEAWR